VKVAWEIFEFVLKNFATPLAFFVVFRTHGAKPAIAMAIAVTCVQWVAHGALRIGVSPFFVVASGFTVLFGGLDLALDAPRFYRLEPFVQNMMLGGVFAATVLVRKPIAEWFAGGLPAFVRPQMSGLMRDYLRKLTLVWSVYFFLKAFLFLYLALTVDLGRLVVLRSAIGGLSLALMFAGEMAYRRWVLGVRLASRTEGFSSSSVRSE
jgi:intracellular septation protein